MTTPVRVRVWDLPTRLFHIALIVCMVGAFVTVKAGSLWMDWHVRFGLAMGVLIVFRLIWGVVGPRYARFSTFISGPGRIRDYLRNPANHMAGHNPLGAWSVILLLAVLGFQAFSGLFTTDDILTSGPLAYLDSAWTAALTNLHKANEWVMLGVVGVHVLAVLFYQLILRKNLIGPMLHGDATLAATRPVEAAADHIGVRLLAALLIIALALCAWWLSGLGAGEAEYM